jgi:hypothetical protein
LKSSQERVYNTGRRIQGFLDANDPVLGSINKTGMRTELDAVVTALGDTAGSQAAGRVTAQGETAKQRTLRLALRLNNMQPIASVAKAKLRTVPNFSSFGMPSSGMRIGSLIAHADGMADAAQPYEQVFLDAGLPSDFLTKLTAAAAAVKASFDTRAAARGQQSRSTASLAQLEASARLTFKALNDFVVPILSADVAHSGLLAEWRGARRIPRKTAPVIGSEQQARLLNPPAPPTPVVPATPVAAPTTVAPATPVVVPAPTTPSTPAVVHAAVVQPVAPPPAA